MRDLSVVLAQFIGDFSSRKSAKMVKFSTDKHAQPNFVRDSCVYDIHIYEFQGGSTYFLLWAAI